MLCVHWNWRWHGPYFIFNKHIAIKDFWIILDLIVVTSTEEKQSHCAWRRCYSVWLLFSDSMLGLLHMCEWVGCPDSCMPGNHLRAFWSPWRRRGSERNAPIVGPGSSHMHSVMVGRFNDLNLIRIPPINLSSMIMNPLVAQFLTLLTLPQVVIAALKASIMALKSIPQAKKQKERFALTPQSFVCVCVDACGRARS